MRLYTDINDLEYYNRYPELDCYFDPVFEPASMLVQANGFTLSGTPTLVIEVCNLAGDVQEDATSNFIYNFRSIDVGGQTYYYCNIKGDTYSEYMTTNRCFTLKVTISVDGATIYQAWTQQYKIVVSVPDYVPPTVLKDGELLTPCVPVDNPTLCIPAVGGYMKFSCYFDCVDTYTGDIYAEGNLILSSGPTFLFERFSHILSRLRNAPNDITRIVSKNCRTQKTQVKPSLQYFGNTHFPTWKMLEIESMFLGTHLYINDEEYQNDGGVYFEQMGKPKDCQYIYKFSAIMTKCLHWQVYGCAPNCNSLASYYMFPAPYARLYDDSMRLIGTDATELKTYFESIPGTTAQELPFALSCQYDTLMKVQSSGVLPKFIYVDNLYPANRIYPKQLSANSTDLSSLCNGLTPTNQVPVPDVTGYDSETINVPVPDVTGYDSVSANAETIQVTAEQNWNIQGTFTSATNYDGQGVLNLSFVTTTPPPYANIVLGYISENGRPSRSMLINPANNGNMPPTSSLVIGTDGSLLYNGPATNTVGNDNYVELFMIRYDL